LGNCFRAPLSLRRRRPPGRRRVSVAAALPPLALQPRTTTTCGDQALTMYMMINCGLKYMFSCNISKYFRKCTLLQINSEIINLKFIQMTKVHLASQRIMAILLQCSEPIDYIENDTSSFFLFYKSNISTCHPSYTSLKLNLYLSMFDHKSLIFLWL